jgi:hypothetical protein
MRVCQTCFIGWKCLSMISKHLVRKWTFMFPILIHHDPSNNKDSRHFPEHPCGVWPISSTKLERSHTKRNDRRYAYLWSEVSSHLISPWIWTTRCMWRQERVWPLYQTCL